MKIAVCYENGQVFQHFGHTGAFKVYECAEGRVLSSEVVSTNGQGHGALGSLLAVLGVDALICGGIGMGAQMALNSFGIRLYAGITGSADDAVQALLNGTLVYGAAANCSHHAEGHVCGEHSCGEHSCH